MTSQKKNFRTLPYLTAITLSTSLLCAAAMAETIYKSVDAEGNISFSNTPPPAGVEAQQIELQPGPTPAEQQQSTEQMQNLEEQSNAMYKEVTAPGQEQGQEEPAVQQDTEYQHDAGENEEPVYGGDGYVDDTDRNERVRDGVEDVRDAVPRPVEAGHAAGRAR
jgi:Domain of unknown function (DUF4124)